MMMIIIVTTVCLVTTNTMQVRRTKKIKKREPSYVRITIQGIPSSFWKGNNNDETNQNTSSLSLYDGFTTSNERDDMVPVSLIFEACFQEEVGN
mmetsp:Transcript_5965/g.6522  ORF Transcript_5965/g.6522 Transcript_5965/m.6522 type:complete len:94 (+) Transcript_5965:548-829(+)